VSLELRANNENELLYCLALDAGSMEQMYSDSVPGAAVDYCCVGEERHQSYDVLAKDGRRLSN
jgi:hypothetical protein